MELSAGVIKWVHSLSQKKNRDKERCFVAEGTKCVIDTLDYFKVDICLPRLIGRTASAVDCAAP